MKNNFQLLAITFTIILTSQFNNTLSAQENAARINLISPGKLSFDYERAYDAKNTIQIGFQKWHQNKNSSSLIPFFGYIFSDEKVTKINGYRTEIITRHYGKKAFNGGFVEGGIYFGKHDITITETSTSVNLFSIFLWNFDDISKTTTNSVTHRGIQVGGVKIGGGYQKTVGHFDFEFSGGINLNALNSQNIRPTLAFKGVSPYAKVAIGVAF